MPSRLHDLGMSAEQATPQSWLRIQQTGTMSLADTLAHARFAWNLRDFLRRTITLEQARSIVRQRLDEREANFVRCLEMSVAGAPKTPYRFLLDSAGCELGDVRAMVRTKGLEATLRSLREAGVHVSFEEFKCRTPIVRSGKVLSVRTEDFDNPRLRRYFPTRSGGTTGRATATRIDLKHLDSRAVALLLAYDAYGVRGAPRAIWRSGLPDGSTINGLLMMARAGEPVERWFSPSTAAMVRSSLKYRLANAAFVFLSRLYGAKIPWPEPAEFGEPEKVASWMGRALDAHGRCFVSTSASLAVRVSAAARAQGFDLKGAVFDGGGEPLTAAKAAEIERAGAVCRPGYGFIEAGLVGVSCARPRESGDQHFLSDCMALIQHPRTLPGSGVSVGAFHFTTLDPSTPKLLLNVESDDYGVVDTSPCGCPLELHGFTQHLRGIRSFQKLTSEGVTLVGSVMEEILHEVLPRRFGGSPLSYQLLDEENGGLTRLILLVSPEVSIPSESAVIEAVMDALRRSAASGDVTCAIWTQADSLRVKRTEPVWTDRGKLMALHRAREAVPATSPKAQRRAATSIRSGAGRHE